ncbi:hypothetical protein B5X24_HaOG212756 [Helicoverpa armigera]|uniref:Peptidase S1 domain-containing protein n=1 Tax=Helicoverpa armigera TaxID=29058 RepID=A0A2W1BFQ8_HELAM|nr:hypothetical protein B5X24_HaOG212756 [Helicoverpa armigera]
MRLLFVGLLILLFVAEHSCARCDMSTTARVREGNLRQSGVFNWLGVLKVHLHEGTNFKVAVSGIVLIKVKYALVNADDVVRVPKNVLESDSLAVFLAADDTPWSVAPLSYMTHPEYEYSTLNTIAVLELNSDDAQDYPLNPICFPEAMFNTSGFLYLTGYTDENRVLEKVIYKILYLEKKVCEEFYNRAGLSDAKRAPTAYVCGFAPYNGTHCVWDNGMVLVSNATGWFTLVGFGVRGPGCAAPARFIDIFQYLDWIRTATAENVPMYDAIEDYRRDDSHKPFV